MKCHLCTFRVHFAQLGFPRLPQPLHPIKTHFVSFCIWIRWFSILRKMVFGQQVLFHSEFCECFVVAEGKEKTDLEIHYWSTTGTPLCSLTPVHCIGKLFWASFCWSALPGIRLQPEQMPTALSISCPWDSENSSMKAMLRPGPDSPLREAKWTSLLEVNQAQFDSAWAQTAASFIGFIVLPVRNSRVLWFICNSFSSWQHASGRSLQFTAPLIPLLFHTSVRHSSWWPFALRACSHTAYSWSAWQTYMPLSQSSGYCFMYTYLYIFITISFNVCSASVIVLFEANWNIFEIITISTRDQEGSVAYWHSYEISSVHIRWRLILDCRKSTRAIKTVWKNVTRWKIVQNKPCFQTCLSGLLWY